ncbi:hypothetical protein RYX45_21235, partial [Alkalihalophilus pseudofirmus]|nr:hypothetical protein [Alkalihalophilus pseudofirmus]
SVNEKINAVAPKITVKGATGIKDEISKNFVKTANGVIFDIFNQLGIELQKNLPDIEKLKTISENPNLAEETEVKIVFTPLHGTANKPVRAALSALGYKNVTV